MAGKCERNGQADIVTRVNRKQTQLVLDGRHRLVLMAVFCRFEVLGRSRQKCFQVTLGDVGESNHLLVCLNYASIFITQDGWEQHE